SRTSADLVGTTDAARATAFPRRATEHSPNLATLDMLRSTGRNPLLLQASRRSRPARQRPCGTPQSR
ncbi:MAG: hypothetical protein ABI890_00215, partial [Lapillicoccus sp.]